jgi:beta-glucosidase
MILTSDKYNLTLNVTNIGDRPGKDVVQVYVSANETEQVYGPYFSTSQLRGFEKTLELPPGAS